MNDAFSWKQMLLGFKELGGRADNIQQKIGPHGNGIYPINNKKKAVIHVPEHLLINVNDIIVDGDDLTINPESEVLPEIRKWFKDYQRYFSWGVEGKKVSERFLHAAQSASPKVLELSREAEIFNSRQFYGDEWSEAVKLRFISSRCYSYNGNRVVFPIIELCNHSDDGVGFKSNNGTVVEGNFEGEVLVNYGSSDCLRRFLQYGFVSPSNLAFSVPFMINFENKKLKVRGQYSQIDQLKGNLLDQKVTESNDQVILDYALMALKTNPDYPKTVFLKILKDASIHDLDEMFDRIRCFNLSFLVDLIFETEGSDNYFDKMLRQAALLQIQTIGFAFGVRKDVIV